MTEFFYQKILIPESCSVHAVGEVIWVNAQA